MDNSEKFDSVIDSLSRKPIIDTKKLSNNKFEDFQKLASRINQRSKFKFSMCS